MLRLSLFRTDERKLPPGKFDYCMLIFSGTPKSSVFRGYFPEQDRYRDEIREFNRNIWASCMIHVKYSHSRRLADLSEEHSFDLE
jgi:hypothetical protein